MTVEHRADVVGSLLGPSELHRARTALAERSITALEFKRVEDAAVDQIIAMQEQAGLDVITDGELRRSHYAGPLLDACDGIEDKPAPSRRYHRSTGEAFVNATPRSVTAPLRLRRATVTEEFSYARARTDKPIKVTLPSPTNMVGFWSPEHSAAAYPDPFVMFADAAEILRQEVDELARLGCNDIQLDAPELGQLVDPQVRAHHLGLGIDPDRLLDEGIELLDQIAAHPGVRFALHLCKGSKYRGWGASGGYDAIASRVFSRAAGFDSFLLEFDDERSGSFAPLRDVPDHKVVVLGLVSTRRQVLEPLELLEARVAEAARFFPRDQLAVSTQCGFASGLEGDAANLRFQRDKLARVAEAARTIWS